MKLICRYLLDAEAAFANSLSKEWEDFVKDVHDKIIRKKFPNGDISLLETSMKNQNFKNVFDQERSSSYSGFKKGLRESSRQNGENETSASE